MSEKPSFDFAQVYDSYHDRVLAYVMSLIGRDEAEDVAQDVFVKIGRALETLEDPSKLTSWIYAITINTVRGEDALDPRRAPLWRPGIRATGTGGR